ncbi:MAG: aminotransferase class V-fold PLP-dependent enzyme [Holophaga sp.]|jgi:glutamate/tyrosine decarboxylase-like PLP-dependent enzyme
MDPSIWQTFAAQAEQFRSTLRDRPVLPVLDPATLRKDLEQRYDFTRPVAPERLLEDVGRLLAEGLVQVTHPRYFGLFNPSVRPVSVLGDALAALYNPQMAARSHAPAACELERRVLDTFTGLIGWRPEGTLATFTTGGAESNLSALECALARHFPGWDEQGLTALGLRPAVYLSQDAHHSFVKAARMAGLGAASVREVPVDPDRRLDLAALERMLDEDRAAGWHPCLLVATLGATGTGVLDPVAAMRPVADRHGLWLHADAAWGGGALLSPALRPHLEGIDLADSVTWDAHKWLSVPMGAGMYFCRHPEAARRAFALTAAYMPPPQGQEADDPYVTTIQWSRRHIGLKVFMGLAELGLDGYARLIEAQAALGDHLRARLQAAGWTLANRTPLPVVCFHRPGTDPARVLARIYRDGKVWISSLALPGGPTVLRACITSYLTTEADVEALVAALESAREP